jgi:hypothetical protein
MKKFFFLAVAAIVALAACSENRIDTDSIEGRVINFNTVANKATKAPISGTVYSYDLPSFGVFAYYLASGNWNTSGDNTSAVSYMNDVEVAFNDTKDIWAPSSTYYWPLEGKLTFIAYSPKSAATAAFSTAGVLTLTGFTVNTTVASQVDLLYSAIAADKTQNEDYYEDSANNQNSATAEGDKGVNIEFKHALSQVIFKAKTADEVYDSGLSFKVDAISVNAASTATSMTVTNPTNAQLASAITTWNTPSTNANFAVSSTAFPAAANTYLTKTLSDPIGDPLLMIPVTAFAGTDPTVTISYTLYRMSDNVDLGSKEVTIHFDNIDDVVTAWQAGKKYVYNLTIDLQKIYFNPSIVDWADGGSQDVDVPDDAS